MARAEQLPRNARAGQCAAAPLTPGAGPDRTFKQHHSRSTGSASCDVVLKSDVQHRECSRGRDAPSMFLTPGEATAEDPAGCQDAEPDLAGCVHAVGVHPKVIYEALHLNLQMPLGNSVLP